MFKVICCHVNPLQKVVILKQYKTDTVQTTDWLNYCQIVANFLASDKNRRTKKRLQMSTVSVYFRKHGLFKQSARHLAASWHQHQHPPAVLTGSSQQCLLRGATLAYIFEIQLRSEEGLSAKQCKLRRAASCLFQLLEELMQCCLHAAK